ncbi:hypothetical protein LFUMFP_270034 [Latilactobacillus fuchuensis]|uniref:Uncharacterized protein n=1 Tax=Latilactobacillus fuchuensis TaxID=164393 RepID=A0A2N9DW17_9LACO|nr:hypothetical protein LFUMFP_270034 [Latilactobacillus fuchuensis]
MEESNGSSRSNLYETALSAMQDDDPFNGSIGFPVRKYLLR